MEDENGGWVENRPADDGVYKIYYNQFHEVRVERFEDGTWDTYFNDSLISNSDTPEEADARARELMEEEVEY